MTNEQQKKCWICGDIADTSEHIIKRSDLSKLFRRNGKKDNLPFLAGDKKLQKIQSPKSELVKYPKNLCAKCNNHRTQPFDHAYEEFIDWFDSNQETVRIHRVIDFKEVYGENWLKKQLDLFRYFAKAFGCRLNSESIAVPNDIVHLLFNDQFETGLYVRFAYSNDIRILDIAHPCLVSYDLEIIERQEPKDNGYLCGQTYEWLDMRFEYCIYHPFADEHLGSPWAANSRCVYLGWKKVNDELTKKVIDIALSSNRSYKCVKV